MASALPDCYVHVTRVPFGKGRRDLYEGDGRTCHHSTLEHANPGKHNSRSYGNLAHLASMRCTVLHLMALLVYHHTKPFCPVFSSYQATPIVLSCSSAQE